MYSKRARQKPLGANLFLRLRMFICRSMSFAITVSNSWYPSHSKLQKYLSGGWCWKVCQGAKRGCREFRAASIIHERSNVLERGCPRSSRLFVTTLEKSSPALEIDWTFNRDWLYVSLSCNLKVKHGMLYSERLDRKPNDGRSK
jgi:hypothetical protein